MVTESLIFSGKNTPRDPWAGCRGQQAAEGWAKTSESKETNPLSSHWKGLGHRVRATSHMMGEK